MLVDPMPVLSTEWAIRSRSGQVWKRTPDRGEAEAILVSLKRSGRRGLELVHRQVSPWEMADVVR